MTSIDTIRRQLQAIQYHNGKLRVITKVIPGCINESELQEFGYTPDNNPNVIRRFIIGIDGEGHLL